MELWVILGLAALAVLGFALTALYLGYFSKGKPPEDEGPPMIFPLASAFNDPEYYEYFAYNNERGLTAREQGYQSAHLMWMFENFMRWRAWEVGVNDLPRYTTPDFPFWLWPEEITWQDVVRRDAVLEELKRGPVVLRQVPF